MKRWLSKCVYALLFGVLATPLLTAAQSYPVKPVRIVVAIAGSDYVARLVAQKLTESLGQPVVVETQTGAGGMMGAELAARAAPDGHTLLLASASQHVMRLYLSRSTPYDPLRDFAPIILVGETLQCILVSASLPVNTLPELIQYAKANPGKVSYATSGIGTGNHLASELISQLSGIQMIHVPFKTGAQAMMSVVGGQVPVVFAILATATPQLRAGKVKVLAVINDRRSNTMPSIPTVKETLPAFQTPPYWFGFFTQSGVPPAIVSRLNGEIAKVITPPEVRAKLDEIGFTVVASSAEEFSARVKRDIDLVGRIVKTAGIQPTD